MKCGTHIAVDSVVNLFSEKNRKKITPFAVSACMVFVITMFIDSYEYISLLKEIEIEMEDLPILERQAKIILPLNFALMFYRLVEVMIDVIKDKILLIY
ncbi:TRAP transporter small permease [Candidatus Ruthia endofausta]|uniref:TRAP transporter small permease n=1 Tax=Candidatus Ruthia endofausta TaxID=2738852 RepID=UPI001FE574CE|nr:TRAP transporter small permease subunit [Candidatus Ruthia endofausta]